jgi:predicted esterase
MHEVMPDLTRALAGGIAPATLSNREFAVEQVGSDKRTNAPTTLRTMMNRLQTTAVLANGTVRIESWVEAGRRHFIVYLPGTQDWSPIPASNPLNLPSDLQAFANSKSDSQSALLLALRNAGAKPGDEIIFVAHSQGGLVAANFAQHPSGFNVSSILSFAAPMVAVGALRGTKVLALEHSNDPMPYLAGKANPIAANWVTIEAEAPKGGIAAHELKSYGAMTTRADKSGTPEIEKARESLLARFRGKRVKVQLVKLKRKPS